MHGHVLQPAGDFLDMDCDIPPFCSSLPAPVTVNQTYLAVSLSVISVLLMYAI